ncbi:MAG: hypothetical protein P4L84_09145 [Isosphaeraceae bacterium]|nr:hypothetical protein [Isosphaeraceae bacterium]
MRRGQSFASLAIGVGLVLSVTLWINSGRPIQAQPGGVLNEEPKVALPLPPSQEDRGVPSLPGTSVPPVPLPETSPAVSAAPAPEDPEKVAESFVDKTKQQAETQIKALTTEAEQLRARLKKVESAIARWQTLRSALEPRPAPAQAAALPPSGPTQLEPAPLAPPPANDAQPLRLPAVPPPG